MSPASAQMSTAEDTQDKRSSLRPKASFLSRVTSRPSLSARYSSADLKSSARSRGNFFKSQERVTSAPPKERPDIAHPVIHQRQASVADKDMFSKPRIAPSPPVLSLQSPNSSLLDSPPAVNDSPTPKPSDWRTSALPSRQTSPEKRASRRVAMDLSNGHPTAISMSPDSNQKSPRVRPISTRDQPVSPEVAYAIAATNTDLTEPPAPRRRPTYVRVGSEKVTLSVANVLESGLGVEIGDSEESSYYDDSYEEKWRSTSQKAGTQGAYELDRPSDSMVDSSDLPILPGEDDFDQAAFMFPKRHDNTQLLLDSQSPLRALMAAANDDTDRPQTDASPPSDPAHQKATSHRPNGRPSFFTASVDRLDRISECSSPTSQISPTTEKLPVASASAAEKDAAVQSSPELTQQLQSSLDAQCARFDRLAAHMLDIIQRHQNEKIQLEARISLLEKEARRSEREIKALRQLLSQSNQRAANRGGAYRLTRATSMQSFLSNISFKDDDVDVSLAIDMLSRVSALEVTRSSMASKDDWALSELCISPSSTPKKAIKAEMRRSRTMPNLRRAMLGLPPLSPLPLPSPLLVSPDISDGVGLGLDFPIPGPLNIPSISDVIITSKGTSYASIPALTAAPTAASGLSLATEKSFQAEIDHPPTVLDASLEDGGDKRSIEAELSEIMSPIVPPKTPVTNEQAPVRTPKSAREKRMAGEWYSSVPSTRLYRTVQQLPRATSPPNYAVPDLPKVLSTPASSASEAYAANLNKTVIAPSLERVMEKDSPDLDELFSKIVASGSSLLG